MGWTARTAATALVALATATAAVASACGGAAAPAPSSTSTVRGTSGPATGPSTPPSPAPSASLLPLDPRNRRSRAVSFRSADGIQLGGRVFGSGHRGVVLAHMGSPRYSQADWLPVASMLARRGYLVLTFDFRGVCFEIDPNVGCSGGDLDWANTWKDVQGAAAFLRSRGAGSIVLMGADLGATASLYVASLPGSGINAVVSVSGLETAEGYHVGPATIRKIHCPKLFIAGNQDDEAAAAYADWLAAATPPTRGLSLSTDLHGTFLFAPLGAADVAFAAKARTEVLRFLHSVG